MGRRRKWRSMPLIALRPLMVALAFALLFVVRSGHGPSRPREVELLEVILTSRDELDSARVAPFGFQNRRFLFDLQQIDDCWVCIDHDRIALQILSLAAYLAQYFIRHRRSGLNLPSAVTVETRLMQHPRKALARSFARHFDEPELADAIDRRFGLVLGQRHRQEEKNAGDDEQGWASHEWSMIPPSNLPRKAP